MPNGSKSTPVWRYEASFFTIANQPIKQFGTAFKRVARLSRRGRRAIQEAGKDKLSSSPNLSLAACV